MRNKNKSKSTFHPTPPFLPDSPSLPTLLLSLPLPNPYGRMWNECCGLCLRPYLCNSFILIAFPCSLVRSVSWDTVLHYQLFNNGPFYRLQFLMNCSSMGLFLEIQSFRNRSCQKTFSSVASLHEAECF